MDKLTMIDKIKSKAVDRYGWEIFDKSRRRPYVNYRQMIMAGMREKTNLSLYEIGRVFNKDHATVLHSVKNMDNLSYIKEIGDELNYWMKAISAIWLESMKNYHDAEERQKHIYNRIERLEREINELKQIV